MSEAEAMYAHSPSARFYNSLVSSAIEALVSNSVNRECRVRLLEIGAGTGATTA